MDHTTHEVRRAYWQDIINQCQNRPVGMSAKQWMEDNDVKDKAYYYWLRKFRKEAYNQMHLPMINSPDEVTFAEVNKPIPMTTIEADVPGKTTVSTVAVIHCNGLSVEVSSNISGELLTCIMKEVCHA